VDELSNERKRQISLEEVFREEVRKHLQRNMPISLSAKVIGFLNQPVVLWALSTAVVAVAGLIYSRFSESLATRRENAATTERLNNQYGARFGYAQMLAAQATKREDYEYLLRVLLFGDAFIQLYPEYRNVSLLSLAWQWDYLEEKQGDSERRSLDEIAKIIIDLASLRTRLIDLPAKAPEEEELFRAIQEKLKELDHM
jgi:hypothetical protein